MNGQGPPAGISTEEWAAMPAAVKALVTTLLEGLAQLQETTSQLQRRVAELEERLNQNSSNSSKPPSSDPPTTKPGQRQPSGRKAGGQPGHKGHGRQLKPLAAVDEIIEIKPVSCAECGGLLLGEDPTPARHQVTEIPRIEPWVTEYRRHKIPCLACGTINYEEWPDARPPGAFGPRLTATVGYLTGRMGSSQRDVAEMMAALFHTEVSLGSIPALNGQMRAALAEPVEAAHEYIQGQPVVNVDETGWHQKTQRMWLWVAVTPVVTVFLLAAARGSQIAKQLLGETFTGIVGSDRWSAYNWLANRHRQLCWAHLKRDFQAFVDRGDESAKLGAALLQQEKKLFDLWYRVRDGTFSRPDFQAAIEPIRDKVGQLLHQGTSLAHQKTAGTCRDILKREEALWTFVNIPGVEPTNNNAERPLRRPVLWRRRSFGTQSEAGSRFGACILTAVTTLQQQNRDVLDYLTEACAAAIRGDKPPSLLPAHVFTHSHHDLQ